MLLRSVVFAALVATAMACSCFPSSNTEQYNRAGRVFRATVLTDLGVTEGDAINGYRSYAVRIEQVFKGCGKAGDILIVRTGTNSAMCGLGELALTEWVFSSFSESECCKSSVDVVTVASCDYNRQWSSVDAAHKAFLQSRHACCKCTDSCACADGSRPVNCLVNPCTTAKCGVVGSECRANYCGGCHAEWFKENEGLVCAGNPSCSYDGKTFEAGEEFKATDGCNTCTCGTDGSVSCTEKACLGCTHKGVFYKPKAKFTVDCEKCRCSKKGKLKCKKKPNCTPKVVEVEKPCGGDKPLVDSSGDSLFCGRGPNRVDCPKGSTCDISPTDRFAVCCPDKKQCGPCLLPPCAAPPPGCHYEAAKKDACGCPDGCGELKCDKCPPICPLLGCPPPRPGCRVVANNLKDECGCAVGCGDYLCDDPEIPENCGTWFDGCNNCKVSNGKAESCTKKKCTVLEEPKCLTFNPPKTCVSWFDGCNTCQAVDGEIRGCTRKACRELETPRCLKFSGPPAGCVSWFDGCNTCSLVDGKRELCTLRACLTLLEPKCLKYEEPKECPKFATYSQCASACPKTCDSSEPRICAAVCREGCQCNDGYVLHEGQCIKPGDCPASNQKVPDGCVSWFDGCNTCSVKDGVVDSCTKKLCLRLEEPKCLKFEEPKVCPKFATYSLCASACPKTCDDEPRVCAAVCVEGCKCNDGYVLHEGQCIKPGDCPASNKIPVGCVSWFDGCNTCSVEDGAIGGCTKKACKKLSQPKCLKFASPCSPNPCPKNKQCVPRDIQCFTTPCPQYTCQDKCQANASFNQCGSACPEKCGDPIVRICTEQCVAGCFCDKGYVLSANGKKCVKKDTCPPVRG